MKMLVTVMVAAIVLTACGHLQREATFVECLALDNTKYKCQ